MSDIFKTSILLAMILVIVAANGCRNPGPNMIRFVKGEMTLEGGLRQTGRAQYVSLTTSDLAAMRGIGFELPHGRIVGFNEVSVEWLRTHSTYVEASGSEPLREDFLPDVIYHFYLDEEAYRFGVRDGEIVNFGMNPAPLGLGLKPGVLWDICNGIRYPMPLSSDQAKALFGEPDSIEKYRFYMN